MKKRIGFVLAGVAGLCLFACGGPAGEIDTAKFEMQQRNYARACQILERAQAKYPENRMVDSLLQLCRKSLAGGNSTPP